MEERFTLADGQGWLTVREDGVRVCCRAERKDDGRGLYKVYLRGQCGKFLLGTLIPENGVLRLERTLSRNELSRRGFWPVEGAAAELAFAPGGRESTPPGWKWEECPGRLMGDAVLTCAAEHSGRALLRREEEGFCLAFRCRMDREFPLTPLFCFAQVERLGEREHVVFHFNGHGYPRLTYKNGKEGEAMEEFQTKE